MTSKLTLGPLLFNWDPQITRDFYFKMADEAPVDVVYLGEIVCAKRTRILEPFLDEIVQRLKNAGKEVVFSTQALLLSDQETTDLKQSMERFGNLFIEANDLSGIAILAGKPHCLGPYINIYNALGLKFYADQGAIRATLPPELPAESIKEIAAAKIMELELQVFGRLPLAISARCAHARSHGLHKHNCQYVCGNDTNGLDVFTLDNQPFLAVNGLQTLSYTYCNLLNELDELKKIGISLFRLSPHDTNMLGVIKIFRDVLDGKMGAKAGQSALKNTLTGIPVDTPTDITFSNGFYYNEAGFVEKSSD